MPLEDQFDTTFIAALASREKQIQQTYRPVIGIHKWFARRPGTLFRGLLLAEFVEKDLAASFFEGHRLTNRRIADPFMGGGTPLTEANRLGMQVIGSDINPMAYWTVRQTLAHLDPMAFKHTAERVAADVESTVGLLYKTRCVDCGEEATIKYFLWVKQATCSACEKPNDLFPGYLVAKDDRHTAFVWYCPTCEGLAEIPDPPTHARGVHCPRCKSSLPVEGAARRGSYPCRHCGRSNKYPQSGGPPRHRLFAIEYHCHGCRGRHSGRHFKVPDSDDLQRLAAAESRLHAADFEWIPNDEIPAGDETNRLLRWGYRRYRDLFNDRQLLGLQTLLQRIKEVADRETRWALATVFSDSLRYQNMLCRYDSMALKCQDIFSVHGFPVGLIQCENNLLGIPGIGGGGFRHFVEKYLRAKGYCAAPYEIVHNGSRKREVRTVGERIEAQFASNSGAIPESGAYLQAGDSRSLEIEPGSLDGVFTDPPYFDNVQYAELMDFCFVWLRLFLADEVPAFGGASTRHLGELTGNATLSRGMEEFTEGISLVFRRMAAGLKAGAPLVFTYHHNDPGAYVPLIVAILDAGLACTAVLSCPAEMSASLHINGTGSSTVDSIFVCRKGSIQRPGDAFPACLQGDARSIEEAGLRVSPGDIKCMALGHISRMTIAEMSAGWDVDRPTAERMASASRAMQALLSRFPMETLASAVAAGTSYSHPLPGAA